MYMYVCSTCVCKITSESSHAMIGEGDRLKNTFVELYSSQRTVYIVCTWIQWKKKKEIVT